MEAAACELIPGLLGALVTILLLVLFLPFKSKKIEENLEPFFLFMGLIGVAVNYYYHTINNQDLVLLGKKALVTPVSISGTPIGITQVVLIFGLIFYYYHKQIYRGIDWMISRLGFYTFVLVFIILFGLISSIISVIVTAVILAEIAAALKIERKYKVEFVVLASFSVGLGAALTPVGEPLSTIAISKLNESFDFLLKILGAYVIAGIILIAAYTVYRLKKSGATVYGVEATYGETLRGVIERTIRVYIFVAALELLGHSFSYLAVCYFNKLPPWALYWLNTISAVVDNATLTAAEINKAMTIEQIRSALMGLLISGGMLIPGNIPNIVAAGRLRITSKEWARVGVPFGMVLLLLYFIVLEVLKIHISIY
jgi:predicted cation transporter